VERASPHQGTVKNVVEREDTGAGKTAQSIGEPAVAGEGDCICSLLAKIN
jgi:hypothetical protein